MGDRGEEGLLDLSRGRCLGAAKHGRDGDKRGEKSTNGESTQKKCHADGMGVSNAWHLCINIARVRINA